MPYREPANAAARSKRLSRAVAITGVSCRFPGAAHYTEFWRNLKRGVNSVVEVPPDRWDAAAFYSSDPSAPNKSLSKWGGFLDRIDQFDHRFFKISPREAEAMDPQQRLLLEEAWHCLEDAGLPAGHGAGRRLAVFVGIMTMDHYQDVLAPGAGADAHACSGAFGSILANRVSHFLGWRGPSATVDAACASSLVALHLARRSILAGESEAALVAAVNLNFNPWKYVSFSKARMLSPTGQCRTFDQAADGYVPGEGVAALFLQPLDRALANGSPIYGLVRGSAINHGGDALSLTAPQVGAQVEVLQAAYADAGIDPRTLGYVEAHGTGTSLGDPIELEALTRAFRAHTPDCGFCRIGSVKTNLGHLEAAAGLAGVIKVLLMMRHGVLAPSLNLSVRNPLIDFERSPFAPVPQVMPWETANGVPRRAGVSSFGFGGANAHVVLEEPPSVRSGRNLSLARSVGRAVGRYAFILSAKSPASLAGLIGAWQEHCAGDEFQRQELSDICGTLQEGRAVFEHRFGCCLASKNELQRQLANYLGVGLPRGDASTEPTRPSASGGKNGWIWRLGTPWRTDLGAALRFLKRTPVFAPLAQAWSRLTEERLGKPPGKRSLDPAVWDPRFIRFGLQYSLGRRLIEVSGLPELITGEGPGEWAALALSGALSLEDGLRGVMGFRSAPRDGLRRGLTWVSIPGLAQTLAPLSADDNLLRQLGARISLTGDFWSQLVQKSGHLAQSQRTFQRFLEEWNPVLASEGIEPRKLLAEGAIQPAEVSLNNPRTRLLALVLLTALRKLDRKWNLAEQLPAPDPVLGDLADLLVHGALDPEDALALILNRTAPAGNLAERLAVRTLRRSELAGNEFLRVLREGAPDLPPIDAWFARIGSARLGPEMGSGKHVLDLGIVSSAIAGPIDVVCAPDPATEPEATLDVALRFFLSGLPVRWDLLPRQKPFRRVCLPGYHFDRHAIPRRRPGFEGSQPPHGGPPGPTGAATDASAPLFHTVGQDGRFGVKLTAVQTPCLRDHVIAGRRLAPAAIYLALIDAAVEPGSAGLREWTEVEFPHASEVGEAIEVQLLMDRSRRRFEFRDERKLLCAGSWQERVPANPPGRPLPSASAAPVADPTAIYRQLAERGYQYGPALRLLQDVREDEAGWRAVLRADPFEGRAEFQFAAAIDSALQMALVAAERAGFMPSARHLALPCAIARAELSNRQWPGAVVHVSRAGLQRRADGFCASVGILDELGNARVWLEGVRFKMVPRQYLEGGAATKAAAEASQWKFLRPIWHEASAPVATSLPKFGTMILAGPDTALLRDARTALVAQGARVLVACPGSKVHGDDAQPSQFDWADERAWAGFIGEVTAVAGGDSGVVTVVFCGPGLPSASEESLGADMILGPLALLKYLERGLGGRAVHFVGLGEQVFALGPHESAPGFACASWGGLLSSVQAEYLRLTYHLIDLDVATRQRGGLDRLLEQELAAVTGDWVAYREGRRWVRRYEPIAQPEPHRSRALGLAGPTLITGGLGGIGFQLAHWLAATGAPSLALLGRSALTLAGEIQLAELRQTGCDIRYLQADVSNREELGSALERIRRELGPLQLVVHAAGLIDDHLLANKPLAGIRSVLGPKLAGSWWLSELTQGDPLEAFVICSSVVSLAGNLGQADYAAANGWVDGFAAFRQNSGGPGRTLVINWPLWEDAGMGREKAVRQRFKSRGMPPLPPGLGLLLFRELLSWADGQVVVHRGLVLPGATHGNIEPPSDEAVRGPAGETGEWSAFRRSDVEEFVVELVAAKTRMAADSIQVEESFFALGIESIVLGEIQEALEGKWAHLPPTLLFEQPNVRALVDYLANRSLREPLGLDPPLPLPDQARAQAKSEVESTLVLPRVIHAPRSSSTAPPVAIIGMHGRFPMAPDLARFWENLKAGRNCVEEIPAERWSLAGFFDPELGHPKASFGKWGGFIEDVDKFDALFFNLSPQEAELMDPQQRLLLESTWATLEDAGYAAAARRKDRKIGLFLGSMWSEYSLVCHERGYLQDQYGGPGSQGWAMTNRISYYLDFRGPSLALDTACSSSLVAVHLACQSLASQECELAVAGGVNLSLHPSKYVYLSRAQFLSRDGLCRSFGEGGTGYVPGEGVGTVLLKPLAAAMRDGDRIYGVVRGSSTNHGGRATGFSVPNPEAQAELVREALARAGVNPREISYVECHGTGTALGDPIEVAGLSKAFRHSTEDRGFCRIGSVKSNIGHLEAAAGIAGLIKVLLCFRNELLPGTLHCDKLNPKIQFDETPFEVVRALTPWKRLAGTARLAGLSSFGAGGANAHLVLEECPAEQPTLAFGETPVEGEQLVCLSAKSEDRLKVLTANLVAFLTPLGAGAPAEVDLADLAYSLNTGREAFDVRLAALARSVADLRSALARFLSGEANPPIWFGRSRDRANPHRKATEPLLDASPANLRRWAVAWAAGENLDWGRYYQGLRYRRLGLPPYPFKRERHWIGDELPECNRLASGGASAKLEGTGGRGDGSAGGPVSLDSVLRVRPQWVTRFAVDHRVGGRELLPGACLIELARSVIQRLLGRVPSKLTQLTWLHPVAGEALAAEFTVRLSPADAPDQFEVRTLRQGVSTTHLQGRFEMSDAAMPERGETSLGVWPGLAVGSGTTVWSNAEAYRHFQQLGLEYGLGLRSVERMTFGGATTEVDVVLPVAWSENPDAFAWHPALLDGVLQSCLALVPAEEQPAPTVSVMPFAVGSMWGREVWPPRLRVRVSKLPGNSAAVLRFNVTAWDESGRTILELRDFSLRLPHAESIPSTDEALDRCFIFHRVALRSDKRTLMDPEPLRQAGAWLAAAGRSLVLFDSDPGMYGALRRLLTSESGLASAKLAWARPGDSFREIGESVFEMRPHSAEDYDLLLERLRLSGRGSPAAAFLWPYRLSTADRAEDGAPFGDALEQRLDCGVRALFHWSKALLAVRLESPPLGVMVLPEDADGLPPEGAAVSGFCRSLALEAPAMVWKTLALPAGAEDEELARAVLAELFASPKEEVEVRSTGSERSLLGWKPLLASEGVAPSRALGKQSLRRGGVYWITGGVGGLGWVFARYLAREFQARLLLSGRSPISDRIRAQLQELERLGGAAFYVQADITRRAITSRAAYLARRRYGRLDGVVHAAGVLHDSLLRNKSIEAFNQVLAPKIQGTLNLDHATRDDRLGVFVLFSSLVSGTGNLGQTDYAAANRFLDAFAELRARWVKRGKRSGLTLSLGWPLWREGGMRVSADQEEMLRAVLGLEPLETAAGLALFEASLGLAADRELAHLLLAKGDGARVTELLGGKMERVSNVPAMVGVPVSPSAPGLDSLVLTELKGLIAGLLKVPLQEIDAEAPLGEYGFDSVTFTQFASLLNKTYQTLLTPALFFEYSTLSAVTEYLLQQHHLELLRKHGAEHQKPQPPPLVAVPTPGANEAQAAQRARVAAAAAVPSAPGVPEPIAVVGMAGVFPKSGSPEALWRNIMAGQELISEVPPERWDWQAVNGDPHSGPNRTRCKWGGFWTEMDQFDPLFFGLSPKEAEHMDPQQRVFLETVWHALEDAGYRPSALAGTKTGVFVGVSTHDYEQMVNERAAALEGFSATGTLHSILANRISYLLDLRGPSEVVDTACSSSLVAVHHAVRSLRQGECEVAVAGGVNALLRPQLFFAFDKAGMLAPDGRCKTFDRGANGYVRAEGAGALVLKPLRLALRDGDAIYGLILSSAVNHGGKANSLTAPRVDAQAEVLIDAYQRAGIDLATVGYIETHGTGTELGDPIEVNALKKAFSKLARQWGSPPREARSCGLGSVKTHVGHLETAAGITGLIQALLAMRHRMLPPLRNFQEPNPYLELTGSPFFLVTSAQPWAQPVDGRGQPTPRRAGVSSFGFGGVNAHVVLEEYTPSTSVSSAAKDLSGRALLVLSAKTPEALHRSAVELRDWLRRQREAPEEMRPKLSDVAGTLQTGREAFTERLAWLAGSLEEAITKLDGWIEGASDSTGMWRGASGAASAAIFKLAEREDREFLGSLFARGHWERLGELWARGVDLPWGEFGTTSAGSKVRLPGYPFARQRYWVGAPGGKAVGANPGPEPGREGASAVESVRASGPLVAEATNPIPALALTALRWVESDSLSLSATSEAETGTVIVFRTRRDGGLASSLVEAQPKGRSITVHLARRWHKASEELYAINPGRRADYECILRAAQGPLDLYFLGAFTTEPSDAVNAAAYTAAQETGVFALFNLLQAVTGLASTVQVRKFCVVTRNVYPVTGAEMELDPAPGGITGLLRVARREQLGFPLLYTDIDEPGSAESGGIGSREVARRLRETSPETGGGILALRQGKLFYQALSACPDRPAGDLEVALRRQGVYVILGGAGGVGAHIARFLAARFQARLVLVGRGASAPRHRSLLQEIETLGGQAFYLGGDLARKGFVEEVLREAETRFGGAHGIIHSVATTADAPLSTMDEAAFRGVVGVQAMSMALLIEACRERRLDFLCVFSSAAPLLGLPGTANYSAGCSARDALGLAWARRTGCPLRIINWGFWQNTGLGAVPGLEGDLRQRGVRPITPQQGVEAFVRVLAGGEAQVTAARVEPGSFEAAGLWPAPAPGNPSRGFDLGLAGARSIAGAQRVKWGNLEEGYALLRHCTRQLLLKRLIELGAVTSPNDPVGVKELQETLKALPEFTPLLAGLLDLLQQAGFVTGSNGHYAWAVTVGAELTRQAMDGVEAAVDSASGRHPDFAAHFRLLRHCLAGYGEVLRGEKSPLELLFPKASFELMAPIYRGNRPADQFNAMTAAAVCDYVRARRGKEVVRILEVGAGTGSTTAVVLEALDGLEMPLEYHITDVSAQFTEHLRDTLGRCFSFCRFGALNIENPIQPQGYAPNSFDVVLATNVFHATLRLDASLGQARKLLKPGGLLALNEVTRTDDYLTVLFGILPGWWRGEDREARLPHSPLADCRAWERLLRGAGFARVESVGPDADRPPEGNRQSLVLGLADTQELPEAVGQAVSGLSRTPMNGAAAAGLPANAAPVSPRITDAQLEQRILRVLAGALRIEETALDRDTPFVQYGVDSLVAIQIAHKLSAELRIELRKTDLYNFATVRSLSAHIAKNYPNASISPLASLSLPSGDRPVQAMGGERSEATPVAATPRAEARAGSVAVTALGDEAADSGSVAIIGMACRFPDADSLDALWSNLAAGRNSVREVPLERWDLEAHYDPDPLAPRKTHLRCGGFLPDLDCFDSLFFNISPDEARVMDPQQRLVLEEAWKALEDAGYPAAALSDKRCGVFVGVAHGDFERRLEPVGLANGSYASIGNSCAILPARVAYFFNLKGPCFAIDTGCSSSLVALHQACQSLLAGESELAIAAGSNALNTPDRFVFFSKAGMASPTGRCWAFDQRADGFVPAEGVAVVVLKKLGAAIRDGDRIYAVIKASGINQDGKTNGITAPSATSQTALELEVYRRAGISPDTLDYVEAHGTGTKLGDPIEVHALTDAFRVFTKRRQFCALGSVKTNIGHTMACAGLAGLLKVALALQARQIPPSLNFGEPNEHIDFADSPFYVPTALRDWTAPADRPRRAAVSSFGFSGTNAHIVLEEWSGAARILEAPQPEPVWCLATLSARTPEALRERAARLLEWLEGPGRACAPHQLCHTLNARRSHLPARAVWLFRSRAECLAGARSVRDGSRANPLAFTGRAAPRPVDASADVAQGPPLAEILAGGRQNPELARAALEDLARLYASGKEVDWAAFYAGVEALPISLPAYPFARERHRLPSPEEEGRNGRLPAVVTAPPTRFKMVPEETTAPEVCAQLEPEDPLLRDHVAGDRAIAPAALLIEIVRDAADRRLAPRRVVAFRRVYWHTPLILEGQPVETGLRFGPDGSMSFEFMSQGSQGWNVHLDGDYVVVASAGANGTPLVELPVLDRFAIAGRCPEHWTREQVYETFARSGWHYGPAYQTIQGLRVGSNEVLAELEVPSIFTPQQVAGFKLFPPLLDGALQAAIGLCPQSVRQGGRYLPVSADRVEWFEPLTSHVWARVETATGYGNGSPVKKFDVTMVREDGRVVARVLGFTLRLAAPQADTGVGKNGRAALLRGVFRKVRERELNPEDARQMLGALLE